MKQLTPVPKVLQDRVLAVLRDCLKKAEAHFNREIKMPTIRYDLRGTTGGQACSRDWSVRFNSVLLIENTEKYLATTVPHEMAHLVDHAIYDSLSGRRFVYSNSGGYRRAKRSVHGDTWIRIMWLFGVANPTRCHNYDVTNARVKEKQKFEYRCSHCNAQVMVGPKIHTKLQHGAGYFHRPCGRGHTLILAAKVEPAQVLMAAMAQKTVTPTFAATKKTFDSLTKKQQAMIIFQDLYGKGHGKEVTIQRFIDVLNMTPAGASTYFYNCKKESV